MVFVHRFAATSNVTVRELITTSNTGHCYRKHQKCFTSGILGLHYAFCCWTAINIVIINLYCYFYQQVLQKNLLNNLPINYNVLVHNSLSLLPSRINPLAPEFLFKF